MQVDKWTDKELFRLEQRIKKEYSNAQIDLTKYFDHYYNGWDEVKDGSKIHHAGLYERKEKEFKAYEEGKYHDPTGRYSDEEMFNRWLASQEGRGEHIELMMKQMDDRLVDAGKITQGYANGVLPKVWINNNNAVADLATESAMEQGIMGVRFDLVDEYTVKRLMEGSREVRPYKPIVLDIPKMSKYNRTKIQNAVLEGILAGDSIDKVASRLEKVVGMNRASAIRNARTAVTGAQSGGKQSRYEDLADKGCIATKIWVATEDDRTRPEHADADGQEVNYDEPFDVGGEEMMFPCDLSMGASDWNVYNCRCTTKAGKFTFTSILSDRAKQLDTIEVISSETDTQQSNNNNVAQPPTNNAQNSVTNIKEAKTALVDEVGFEKLGRLGALNEELVVASANQLVNLENRFNVVHSSINPSMIAKNNGGASAYVSHSVVKPLEQLLSLCPRGFAVSEADHVSAIERAISKGWHMPADKNLLNVYDVTHEYGHMLENKIIAEMYNAGYASKHLDFAGRIDYIKADRMALKDIKDEIIDIAKSNNPNFDLLSNISEYGKSNSAEFFAETFANSQLGQPNELGNAMNTWLQQKGY